MPAQNIVTPVDANASFQHSAKPMLLAGQVLEDYPESGVVRTAFGYRDRSRVPEFSPHRR